LFLGAAAISLAVPEGIPTGYPVGRYLALFERNPFVFPGPSPVPVPTPSPFAKLVLESWAATAGGETVVYIRDTETNTVERLTTAAAKDKLRLVELHLNADVYRVAAVLAEGPVTGVVKFRTLKSTVNPGGEGSEYVPTAATSAYRAPVAKIRTRPLK
jgi:hypothetical protein